MTLNINLFQDRGTLHKMSQEKRYVPLQQSPIEERMGDGEPMLGAGNGETDHLIEIYQQDIARQRTWSCLILVGANIVLFIISLVVLIFSWRNSHQSFDHHLQQVSAYCEYKAMNVH